MILENTIICGDSAAVLADLPMGSVDLVVTDPPYLCRYRDRFGRTIANDDSPSVVTDVFHEVERVMKPNTYCISFYGWTGILDFAEVWKRVGLRPVGHIVWPKPYASKSGFAEYRHESAFILAKGRPAMPANPISDVQPWEYSGNREHPTEKAMSVIAPLIECFSKPGNLVLDPFLGSGTTAVAAALNDRRYVGIELEERYCHLAMRRLQAIEARWSDAA